VDTDQPLRQRLRRGLLLPLALVVAVVPATLAVAAARPGGQVKVVRAAVTVVNGSGAALGSWTLNLKLARGTHLVSAKGMKASGRTGNVRLTPKDPKLAAGSSRKLTIVIGGAKAPKNWSLSDQACTAGKPSRSGKTARVSVVCTATPTPTPTPGPPPPPTPTGPTLFSRVPYADMTLGAPSNLPDLVAQKNNTGNPGATASFITALGGSQCKGAWGGSQDVTATTGTYATTLASRLSSFRAAGGQLVLAFGGLAGYDIAQKCATWEATRDAYQQAIDAVSAQYGGPVTHIDLDVETNDGAFSTDTAAIDRQSKAIAALQAVNSSLVVTYTLQTEPKTRHDDFQGGMMTAPKAVLANAKANGVRIDGVNGMAMDYGSYYSGAGDTMGADAISVAETIRHTLGEMYPSRTDAELWRMVGITPMIGRNDIVTEVFTLADMTMLVNWAKAKPIGMLGMWSVSRDKPCTHGENTSIAQAECHSIVGGPADWAFGTELSKFGTP